MPDTSLEAVLFDYGQVLSAAPDPADWEHLRLLSGLDPATLQHEYWLYRHSYDRGGHTGEFYWKQIAADTGRTYTPQQIESLFEADYQVWARPNQPMLDWAAALQSSGIRTGILSNIGDQMAARFIQRFPWLKKFTHCTWSYALNLAKPEPEIYHAAAAGLGLSVDRILFVDDIQRNIDAAHLLGMNAILYVPGSHDRFLVDMKSRNLTHLLTPTTP